MWKGSWYGAPCYIFCYEVRIFSYDMVRKPVAAIKPKPSHPKTSVFKVISFCIFALTFGMNLIMSAPTKCLESNFETSWFKGDELQLTQSISFKWSFATLRMKLFYILTYRVGVFNRERLLTAAFLLSSLFVNLSGSGFWNLKRDNFTRFM